MKLFAINRPILNFYLALLHRFCWLMVAALLARPAFAGTAVFDCDSARSLINSISKIENDNANWAKTQTSQSFNQGTLGEKSEGRRLQLFSAELLPKTASFVSIHRQCWMFFVDFEENLKNSTRVKSTALSKISQALNRTASENFERWYNCVEVSITPLPSEAAELKTCWEKISSADHHP